MAVVGTSFALLLLVGAQQILGLAFAMLGIGLRREYFVDRALFTLAPVVRKYGQKEGVMAGKNNKVDTTLTADRRRPLER